MVLGQKMLLSMYKLIHVHSFIWIYHFLVRRDKCPESYCRTPGVGVRVRVHKNFNIAYNSWITIGKAFIFHMCIPCDKTFPLVPKFLTWWPWPWSLIYFKKKKTLTLAIDP